MAGSFVLDNAKLWVGDGTVVVGHVVVNQGTIEAVCEGRYDGDLPSEDLQGQALSPGLIDLMVLAGFDRSILRDDPRDIAREYLRLGVTHCQFCIGTLPWESMAKIVEKIAMAQRERDDMRADVIGLYLEGPFQHPDLTGASLRDYALPPVAEHVGRILNEFGDVVTMVNVSPGTEGDEQAVRALTDAGKVVSMAHSNADAARVLACVDAGTTVLGHVWDNNSGRIGDSGVQQPTLEHVALTDERVRYIHQICDGTHAHPIMVKLVHRCRGSEAICLVTDAVSRAGRPDGPFVWDDGRQFTKKDGVGRTDQGWLCGSALLLPDHFRNFVRFTGVPPYEAIRTVTLNPAASLNMADRIGILAAGRAADLVMWDDTLRVRRIWRNGNEVQDVNELAEVTL